MPPAATQSPAQSGLQQLWWQPQRGLSAQLLRPLSWIYAALARLHRGCYESGLRRPWRAPVPVVVVGNLVVGGAGKTPTTIALVELLQERGWRPGIVSRGYGRTRRAPVDVQPDTKAEDCGDEPLLMRLRTGAPVSVAANRAEAARRLLAEHPDVDIIVADDGLQHWRLARDVEVIVFDARGIGNGLRLPAGPLRQRVPRALPRRSLVLYNAAAPSLVLPGFLAARRLCGVAPLNDWWHGSAGPSFAPLESLHGRALCAVAGMAEPERFFSMLESQGLKIDRYPMPDHARYDTAPWPPAATDVLVTEKDAVKLPPRKMHYTHVWVVRLDFELPPEFRAAFARALPPSPAPPPSS